MSVSVAPIHKKKSWKRKSARLEREDEGAGPSQEEEEEEEELVNETETTRSLSLSELRDMQKDFSRHPGEHIVTWLLRCWDSGANSLELEGKEAKQLGSLSREGGIDKAIGKGEPARSLWRRLLSAIRERYPFKEDVVYRSGKWTTMERDPDEVQCTRPMWRKLVRNAPPSCANSLAILTWKDRDGPTVNEAASNLREYEESISSSFVSAVRELSQEFKRFKEDLSYSLPIRTSVSAIRSQRSSAQERGYRGYTPRGTLWFYLRDHGEDMRKWDGKPTSTLEARVRELQGKTIAKGSSSRKIAARVEKLVVKVRHVDAHVPKSQATEEHQNNQQVDQAAKIEVAQVDLDWQHKGELFIALWAHDTSGHQGRDATYRWARDRGVDLTMDTIAQVIHECETCAAIKQSKLLKPLWYGGRWLKYKCGEAWQIDYITLPQTRQGKRYVLTMVEATTGWLETYPVPHATARNTILGLEKQVLWRHGTPERIESDNGTHFRNNLIDTWAKEHGIEW
ncbi:hypothetical protein QYF61_013327, partial [Mycteria americana]